MELAEDLIDGIKGKEIVCPFCQTDINEIYNEKKNIFFKLISDINGDNDIKINKVENLIYRHYISNY